MAGLVSGDAFSTSGDQIGLPPGELLKLRGTDFAMPGSFTLSYSHAAVRIVSPKNRQQFGEQHFVNRYNPNAIERLRLWEWVL